MAQQLVTLTFDHTRYDSASRTLAKALCDWLIYNGMIGVTDDYAKTMFTIDGGGNVSLTRIAGHMILRIFDVEKSSTGSFYVQRDVRQRINSSAYVSTADGERVAHQINVAKFYSRARGYYYELLLSFSPGCAAEASSRVKRYPFHVPAPVSRHVHFTPSGVAVARAPIPPPAPVARSSTSYGGSGPAPVARSSMSYSGSAPAPVARSSMSYSGSAPAPVVLSSTRSFADMRRDRLLNDLLELQHQRDTLTTKVADKRADMQRKTASRDGLVSQQRDADRSIYRNAVATHDFRQNGLDDFPRSFNEVRVDTRGRVFNAFDMIGAHQRREIFYDEVLPVHQHHLVSATDGLQRQIDSLNREISLLDTDINTFATSIAQLDKAISDKLTELRSL